MTDVETLEEEISNIKSIVNRLINDLETCKEENEKSVK